MYFVSHRHRRHCRVASLWLSAVQRLYRPYGLYNLWCRRRVQQKTVSVADLSKPMTKEWLMEHLHCVGKNYDYFSRPYLNIFAKLI